jgi:class 3 adenylate cyclase
MRLRSKENESTSEPRFDTQTAGKIAALATRLQQKHEAMLSAREIEAIGEEVGLQPDFIREACHCLTTETAPSAQQSAVPAARKATRTGGFTLPSGRTMRAMMGAWWAAGWTLPLMLMFMASAWDVLNPALEDKIGLPLFFFGWAVYLGGGVFLTYLVKEGEHIDATQEPDRPVDALSRTQLIETLFALQQKLESQKRPCAFLSVDVVDSSEMKRQASDLEVEYSFRQFHQWVQEIIRAEGGELQSAAGDGVMCVFSTSGSALRAARRLQEGLGAFNLTRNRLPTPFRIRCGASAGAVAIEEGMPLGHVQSAVIDRAAARQKRAAPGDILVGAEMADAGLQELGSLTRLPDPIAGEPAFSWRAGLPGS